MKWILLLMLWLAAVLVAVAVVWRMWRGRNVVLRGRFSPRFVRMVVIVLVVLGVGVEKGRAARQLSPPADNVTDRRKELEADVPALPQDLRLEMVVRWHFAPPASSKYVTLKQALIKLESAAPAPDAETAGKLWDSRPGPLLPHLQKIMVGDIAAIRDGQPTPRVSARTMIAALDEMEQTGLFYDPWVSGYLWRKTAQLTEQADRTDLPEFYARLHRHARILNTLIRAQVTVSSFQLAPRPWRSKAAAPPRYYRRQALLPVQIVRKQFAASFRRLYPDSDVGTWQRDAVAIFSLADGSPPATLIRGGRRQLLEPGQQLRFNRLDLIQTPGEKPVVLQHGWLRQIELPAGQIVTVWDLPSLLSKPAAGKVKQAVLEALDGDDQAARQLEGSLPLTQRAIRQAVADKPDAKGAPRLRMILTLFDDSLVVQPPATEASQRVEPPPSGNRIELRSIHGR